jgi:hypothetical protein
LSVFYNQDNFLLTRRVLCCCFLFSLCLFITTKHRTAFNFSFIISSGVEKRRIEPRPSSLLLSVSSANRWETPFDALFFFSFLFSYTCTHTHTLSVSIIPPLLFFSFFLFVTRYGSCTRSES